MILFKRKQLKILVSGLVVTLYTYTLMYMCISMFVCTYICTYIRMYVRALCACTVCMYVRMYVHALCKYSRGATIVMTYDTL